MDDIKLASTSINEFALDLYSQLKNEDGNIFCSPYSISCALAMTYSGARGENASQMEKVLHFDNTNKNIHSSFSSLIGSLNELGKEGSYKITTANALWGGKGYKLRPEFVGVLKNQYKSECRQLDFINNPEGSRKEINGWVEKQTDQKIKDLVGKNVINPLTRLILTNAIYFKAPWAFQFDKEETVEAPFYEIKNRKINVLMMRQTRRFNYFEDRGVKILELPYKKRDLSMFVVLPKKIDGLVNIEKNLSAKVLNDWLAKMENEQVEVSLPKFKFESTFNLGGVLKTLGMQNAFSFEKADFSGITNEEKLFISAVLHKTYVDVNEEGAEAAAATAIAMMTTAAPGFHFQPKPKEFKADHPFLFFIQDNRSGSILFIGRMAN